jgi:hypothetical protein
MADPPKQHLIARLPRLDSDGAVKLAQWLESAAKVHSNLPDTVTEALREMASDRAATLLMLGTRKDAVDERAVQELDVVEDAAWGVVRDWLEAWSRLPPEVPQSSRARDALLAIFAEEGLGFTELPFEDERAAGDAKLRVVEEQKLETVFRYLGGQPILEHLRSTHARYAAALDEAHDAAPGLREARDKLVDAIQIYVVRVLGCIERGKPDTLSRAQALLKPIVEWKAGRRPAP